MSRLQRRFHRDRQISVAVASLGVILWTPQGAFSWGREGLQIIGLYLAELISLEESIVENAKRLVGIPIPPVWKQASIIVQEKALDNFPASF